MEVEKYNLNQVISLKVNGLMANFMAMESTFGKMVKFTKDNI
jgi:hypothetical protein